MRKGQKAQRVKENQNEEFCLQGSKFDTSQLTWKIKLESRKKYELGEFDRIFLVMGVVKGFWHAELSPLFHSSSPL